MISIIVPLYNAEPHILKCLESISTQTFSDFECIIINDGSTDKGAEIAQSFASADSRFKYVSQANAGVSIARNRGLSLANGEYICFIDSDDIVSSNYLLHLINAMDDKVDMSVSTYKRVKNGKIIESVQHEPGIVNLNACSSEFYINHLLMMYGPVCKLYRRSIIEVHNLRFNPKLTVGEDFCFNLSYLLHAQRINFITDCDYFYNWTPVSLTNRRYFPLQELYQTEIYHKKFLEKIGLADVLTDQYIYKKLGGYLYDALTVRLNKYKDIKMFVSLFSKEDLHKTLRHFQFPYWMKIALTLRLPFIIFIRLYVNKI